MKKKILITGVAGFIGSNLADTLLHGGHRVMGIDNFDPFYSRKLKEANLSEAKGKKTFELMEGDIRDSGFLNSCMSQFKPEIIVHLAAKAGVRPSLADPDSYYDVNVMGTLRLLESMKNNAVSKLIFASSSSVYGNNKKVPFAETDNVDFPISPYAATKKAGELLCHTFHYLYGFDIFCLRFFTVYGPRQRPDLAISKFTRALFENREIQIYGDGSSTRDYTHINDIIDGIVKAVAVLKGFNIFNLGESNTVRLTALVSMLEKYSGMSARIQYLAPQDGDVERTYADIRKAKELLGYNPVMDIEKGLIEYIDWFKRSGSKIA